MNTKLEPRVKTLQDGTKVWYLGDKIHRDDGPAVEMADGTRYWYRNGVIHRDNGPAVEYSPNGVVEFWVNGVFQSREQSHGETQPRTEAYTPDPQVVTLARKLAHSLQAMKGCQERGNTEWEQRHRSRLLLELEKAFGDSDIALDMERSTPDKLVFVVGEHTQALPRGQARVLTAYPAFEPSGLDIIRAGRRERDGAVDAKCVQYENRVHEMLHQRVSLHDERPVSQELPAETVVSRLSQLLRAMEKPAAAQPKVYLSLVDEARRAGCMGVDEDPSHFAFHQLLQKIVKERMPSGSGFDVGTKIDEDKSRPDRLVFDTEFHHMNEAGYDGWTQHTVSVKPSFVFGLDITISGRDRNEIKDYIHESFSLALGESYVRPPREQQAEAALEQVGEEEDEQDQGLSR